MELCKPRGLWYRQRQVIIIIIAVLSGSAIFFVWLKFPQILVWMQRNSVLRSPITNKCRIDGKGIIRTEYRSYSTFGCPVWEIGKVRFAIPGKRSWLGIDRSDFYWPDRRLGEKISEEHGYIIYKIIYKGDKENLECQFFDFKFNIDPAGNILIDEKGISISGPSTCILIDKQTGKAEVHPLE